MSYINLILKRSISTTTAKYGKRNFRKFPLYNKRGTKNFKEQQMKNPDSECPVHKLGVRDVGYNDHNGKFITIPEKVPDIIVPDLKDFKLKPYVSYKTPDIIQSEYTAEDLFSVIYAPKIVKDFRAGKLDENGFSTDPSPEEKLSPEEAKIKARKTGSDMF